LFEQVLQSGANSLRCSHDTTFEDECYSIFKLKPEYRDIYKIARQYEQIHQERTKLGINKVPLEEKQLQEKDEEEQEKEDELPEVFPPFLPEKQRGDKEYTLVLDLDETLIHFEEENEEIDEKEVFYMVRPGLNQFLSELSQYYELVIFTAALQDYADWILD